MEFKKYTQEVFEEEKKVPDIATIVKALAKDATEFKNMVEGKLPGNVKETYYYERMNQ